MTHLVAGERVIYNYSERKDDTYLIATARPNLHGCSGTVLNVIKGISIVKVLFDGDTESTPIRASDLVLKKPMKLWELYAISTSTEEPKVDKVFGFIINAASELDARTMASNIGKEELSNPNSSLPRDSIPWMDTNYTICKELKPIDNPKVIMQNYYVGYFF